MSLRTPSHAKPRAGSLARRGFRRVPLRAAFYSIRRHWREWREFWNSELAAADPIAEWDYWQRVGAERRRQDEPTERIAADRLREAIYETE